MYELPLGSVRCPVCSSKRITRLYNSAPMVNTRQTEAQALSALTRPGLDKAEKNRLEGAPQDADDWRRRQIRERFAVRPHQLGDRMAEFGMHPALAGAWNQKVNVVGKADVAPMRDPVIKDAAPGAPNIIARYDGEKQ